MSSPAVELISSIPPPPPPGARVEIRGEEWVVRSAAASSTRGYSVKVTGVTELVRGREYIFLTELDKVRELKPEETKLVNDDSPQYRRSRLYLESLLRKTSPTDNALYLSPNAAMDVTSYQLTPAAKALRQPRPRILMADAVGLGKTIEVGVLLTELIERGRGERILVVALKSILEQFQKELWARFTIPLVRLDSVGVQRIQSKIPSSMNPFHIYDRAIVSIDTLKKDAKYRRYLEQCHWDAVVIDECQNVAPRGKGRDSAQSQRARLAELLAHTCDALIMTSATPHDGRPETFAGLINLLEPTTVADPNHYSWEDVSEYVVRRFKKDIAHEVEGAFHDRVPRIEKVDASDAEDAVFRELSDAVFKTVDKSTKSEGVLFRTLLLKGFLSSPAACASTIQNRLKHKDLDPEKGDDAVHDREVLGGIHSLLDKIDAAGFTKYVELRKMLAAAGVADAKKDERVVIFSERIQTLEFLREHLTKDLKLKKEQISMFHGTLEDTKQQDLVSGFGTADSPLRILLASDAASEGINLHFCCHRLIHFDLPWSLITLEQRNGRIDRYGQTYAPEVSYLLTKPSDDKIEGDLRVLDRLIEKEEYANKNLGDAASLMRLYDEALETAAVGRAIEGRETPEQVLPDKQEKPDFMTLLFGQNDKKEEPAEIKKRLRVYDDDIKYAKEAFDVILEDPQASVEWHTHLDGSFTLTTPDDLRRRFELLPKELRKEGDKLQLTTDRKRVMDALAEARKKEGAWPEWQLFWEQHPVGEWIDDRVLAEFGTHDAPVLQLAGGIESDETVFLFQGIASNLRAQPVVVDWFGVSHRQSGELHVRSLTDLLESTGLRGGTANPGQPLDEKQLAALESQLPQVVGRAREWMDDLRKKRAVELSAPLREGIQKLTRWSDARTTFREEQRKKARSKTGAPTGRLDKTLERERNKDEAILEERREWITKTMQTADRSHLRLVAVFARSGK